MNIFNNFSYKLFGVMTVLFFYTGAGGALADQAVSGGSFNARIDNSEHFVTAELASNTSIQKLCESGYYLSSCGSKIVGTNWLKGIQGTEETQDYYSYNLPVSDPIHMDNLRKFFAGHEKIYYNGYQDPVLPNGDNGYLKSRNTILANFCVDEDGSLTNVSCKKCPNNAKISESVVERNVSDGKIVDSSWRIHTIADCYMDEFSDNTGTYVYVAGGAAVNNNIGQRCYYSNTVEGSELVSE